MSDLEIFKLGITLAQALNGDEYAIADLKKIYERHPEMFENSMEILKNVISEVASEYKDFFSNPKSSNDKEFIAYKQLNDRKMGDIGIKNDDGTNVIFHANRQDKRNMNRFDKKAIAGEAVRSLHTQSQTLMGGDELNSSGANALSATANDEIISQKAENSNITDKIHKIKEQEFNEIDLDEIDSNDTSAMDELRAKHNAEVDTDTDKNNGNKPRKNR